MPEGNLDGYLMGWIEFCEDHFNLEELLTDIKNYHIPISEWKKVTEILEDENLDFEKVDKNSSKEFFKRFVKCMEE